MALLNKTLSGSTLVEVVVASVIITASFAVAVSTISGLNADNDVIRKLGYENYIDSLIMVDNLESYDSEYKITVESKEEKLITITAKCCDSENATEMRLTRRRIKLRQP